MSQLKPVPEVEVLRGFGQGWPCRTMRVATVPDAWAAIRVIDGSIVVDLVPVQRVKVEGVRRFVAIVPPDRIPEAPQILLFLQDVAALVH